MTRRILLIAVALTTLSVPVAPMARACSMCRCGDPTFNALGTDVYVAGRFRLAVDWDRLEKESGTEEGSGTDHEVENRFTATLAYSFGDSVTLVARLPWSDRTLTTTADDGASRASARGLSDPELLAMVRVWSAPFEAGMGRRAWLSLLGGVKTPWGENDARANGGRLDEHVQPGTGSTDLFVGASFVRLLDPRSSVIASAQARFPGENRHGYRYGAILLVNAGYERKLAAAVDAVLELNYRHAARDRDSGGDVASTGGGILYATPRVIVSLGQNAAARVSVQIPLVRNLYGDQTERAVANAGLTLFF